MSAKALNFEAAKMAVSAAAMMISSATHHYTIQNKISLSRSLHGMVRANAFDVKPKKSPAPYNGVQLNPNSPGGVKINGSATESLNLNNISVGLKDFVEESRKKLSPDWVGRFVEDSLVFRQCFAIRSYEIGPDKRVSVETLMNLFQETAVNSVWLSGPAGNGFGSTREMSRRNLIWVVVRTQVHVESYPSWYYLSFGSNYARFSFVQ